MIKMGLKLIGAGLLCLGLVSCKSYPKSMGFSAVTHREWPVYVYNTYINGGDLIGWPKAVAAGWEPPKGNGLYVARVSDVIFTNYDDQIVVSASWTELFSNKGWRAELEFPFDKVPRKDGGDYIELVVGYGVNGEFTVHAKKEHDPTKPDLDIEMAFVCGERAPELDHDFRPDIGRKLHAFYYDNESDFIPSSRCSEPKE